MWPIFTRTRSLRVGLQTLLTPATRGLIKGSAWLLIGNFAARLCMLVAAMLVARLLGKAVYGQFGLLQNTLNMLAEIGGLGAGLAVSRLVAAHRNGNPDYCRRVIALNFLIALIVSALICSAFFFAPGQLAQVLLGSRELASAMPLTGATILCSSLLGVCMGVLGGMEWFAEVAKINILQAVFSSSLQIVCALWFGLFGVVLAAFIATLIALIFAAARLLPLLKQADIYPAWASCWREYPLLLSSNLPLFVSGFMVVPITWFGSYMLSQQANGFSELAAFNAANQIKFVLLFIPTTIANVLLPIVSRLYTSSGNEVTHMLKINLAINILVVIALSGIIWPLSSVILSAYGADFSGDVQILRASLVVALLTSVNVVLGTLITGNGNLWSGMLLNTAWAAALLTGMVYWVPTQGAFGLVLAYIVAYGLHSLWQGLFLHFHRRGK